MLSIVRFIRQHIAMAHGSRLVRHTRYVFDHLFIFVNSCCLLLFYCLLCWYYISLLCFWDHKIVSKQVWLLSKVTSQIYTWAWFIGFCLCELNFETCLFDKLKFYSSDILLSYTLYISSALIMMILNFVFPILFFFRMVDSHFKA